MAKNKNKKKSSTRPPAGSYDPILNAQSRASKRGLGYLENDIEQQRERGLEDYNSQVGILTTGRDRALFDLTTGRDRTLADILTGETRAGEDKDRALANLDLQYDRLATRQAEGARVAGVTSQGLLNKSARIRDENETRDQQPILTSFNRAMQDFGTARTRTNEDFTTGSTRVGEDFNTRSGLLNTDYQRTFGTFGDLTTQLTRAQNENQFFQQDINEQKAYQAAQTGWKAPKKRPRGTAKIVGPNRAAGVGAAY